VILTLNDIKPSEELSAFLAFEQLRETPHLPVDLFPNMFLFPQEHNIFVEIPLCISNMLTPKPSIYSDELAGVCIWAD